MHVSAQDRYADRMLLGKLLQAQNQCFPLYFVVVGGVMVVKIVEKIDLSIKVVKKGACNAETAVQESDWSNYGRTEDILKPLEARICNRHAQKKDEVFEVAVSGKFALQTLKDEIVGFGVVDLLPCALSASVNTHKCNTCAELAIYASTAFLNVGTRRATNDP